MSRRRNPWSRMARLAWWLGLLLSWPHVAAAFEASFAPDPAQDIERLARASDAVVTVDRVGGAYRVHASAVLRVDPARLLDASTDYGRYVGMGVPALLDCRVVSVSPDGGVLHTWSWVSSLGHTSKHYLTVRVARTLSRPGAVGIAWQLVPRRPEWPHEEASAFTRLDGSFYIEPLAPGAVYVRYALEVELDPSVPEALVAWVVRRQLREGTRGLLAALAREAARRA